VIYSAGGFFIEAGSGDAEDHSDSIHFELNRGWKVELYPLRPAQVMLKSAQGFFSPLSAEPRLAGRVISIEASSGDGEDRSEFFSPLLAELRLAGRVISIEACSGNGEDRSEFFFPPLLAEPRLAGRVISIEAGSVDAKDHFLVALGPAGRASSNQV
jgi:hypothetical protein